MGDLTIGGLLAIGSGATGVELAAQNSGALNFNINQGSISGSGVHGMNLLAKHPDQRAIWQADVEGVTQSAVEEIVRAASPVTFMRRTATGDVSLGGQDFHEGDKFVMFYGAANRDPRVFDDPERFDVLRQPNPHVGFGGPGPHFCLGANLARREVAVVFRELFKRLPDIEVTGDAVPLASEGIPLVTGIKHLPVTFTPTARSTG